jgi:hypothetical protein
MVAELKQLALQPMVHLLTTKATKKLLRFKATGTVEILLAMSLFMLFGTFIIGALVYSLSTTKLPNIKKSALEYASEGIEVVRYIRKDSMVNIPDGTYGLLKSGAEWTLVAAPDTVATGYTRSITISSPALGRKLITSNVTWADAGTSGVESVSTILTNWQDTLIVSTPWVTPVFNNYYRLTSTTYDVYNLHFIGSTLYALLQNGNSATYLTTYDVTNPSSFIQRQQLNIVSYSRTNAFYTGSRLYVTTGSNSVELVGVNTPSATTNAAYATFNMAGNHDASGIKAVGNLLYITKLNGTPEFSIFRDNNTTFSTTYTLLGSYNAPSSLYDVAVRGNYAYVARNNSTADLLIINVSNSASPSLVTSVNTASNSTTKKLDFWNQYLLIFTSDVGLLIYDCTNPTAPVLTGSIATSGAIRDYVMDQSRNLLFLVTANSAREFQVIDLSTISAPVLRGFYNSSIVTVSIAHDAVNDRIYIGSTDNTNEFLILDAE